VKDNAVELKYNARLSQKLRVCRKSAAERRGFTLVRARGRAFHQKKVKKAAPFRIIARRSTPMAEAGCNRVPRQVIEIA
jgi:hypothetical protein